MKDYDYIRQECCENIKMVRIRKKLTQAELAEKAGIAQSTLSYLEAGTKSPTIDTLAALAMALDVSWFDILPPLEPENQSGLRLKQDTEDVYMNSEEWEAIKNALDVLNDKFNSEEKGKKRKNKKSASK